VVHLAVDLDEKTELGIVILLLLLGVFLIAGGDLPEWLQEPDGAPSAAGHPDAKFVDEPMGLVDRATLGLFRRSSALEVRRGRVFVQVLDADDASAVKLFDGAFVRSVSPGGNHVVTESGDHWNVVRLSDLHAVAEIRGVEPFFLDENRILTVFEDAQCTRGDALILNLDSRTAHPLPLNGPRERFVPVRLIDGDVVGRREEQGDKVCRSAGVAVLDLEAAQVRTVTTEGSLTAVASGHLWVDDVARTSVLDSAGAVSEVAPLLMAEAAGNGIVYAPSPPSRSLSESFADQESTVRFASSGIPHVDDPAGIAITGLRSLRTTADESAVLIERWADQGPDGERATSLSVCSLPDLTCRQVGSIARSGGWNAQVVPAAAFVDRN